MFRIFSPLFGHWEQFLMNMGYLSTYLATGDKLVTVGDLGCISKSLYPFILHFGGFWGIEEAYFDKYCRFCNFDPTGANFFLRICDIWSPIWSLVTNQGQLETFVAYAKGLYPFILHFGRFWCIEEAYFDKY